MLSRWHRHLLCHACRAAEGVGGSAGAAADTPLSDSGGVGDPAPPVAPPASVPASSEPSSRGSTIGDGDLGKLAAPSPDWPADWRKLIAGGDKEWLKQLDRMGSPADVFKSYRELQARLSSGELKAPPKPLPKDASPEQAAAWRKEMGLPDSAEALVKSLALPNGVIPGEADQPLLSSFAEAALAKSWTQEQFNDAVSWYFDQQDAARSQQIERDEAYKQVSLIELGKEWGPEQFQANLNAMQNLLALFPKGVADSLLAGRMSDGSSIGDHAGVLRALVHLARELNPAATVLPAGAELSGSGLADRMAELQKMMGDYRSDYWQGPKAETLQSEFRELVTAQDKMRARQGRSRG
jgi:hypothetical protein